MKFDITITGVECADEDEAGRFAERFYRSLPPGTPWGTMTWEESPSEPEGVDDDEEESVTASRVASYFCRIHHARSGDCPAPAVASTPTLDPHVERALLTALADPASKLVKAHEVGARIEQAAGHVREAEEELDTFLAAQLAAVLGPERYRAEVERRQDQVREAQVELSEALQANAVFVQAGGLRTPEQLVTELADDDHGGRSAQLSVPTSGASRWRRLTRSGAAGNR